MSFANVLPRELVLVYALVLGAIVGSFLNVVIARLPAGESVVRPRSRCPGCKSPIAWYDNIPIVSWLVLRGRCRHCKTRISPRYLVVEVLMAALAAGFTLRLGLSWQLALWLPLAAALLAIVFLDVDHFWVPDVITFPAMAWALGCAFLPGGIGVASALLGLAPALGLWAFAAAFERLTGREGMGLGDIKLLAVLGLALGPVLALIVLMLAAVQGSVVGILVLVTGGHRRAEPQKTEDEWVPHPRAIPFGPFLALAAYEVVLVPEIFVELPRRLMSLGWWLG